MVHFNRFFIDNDLVWGIHRVMGSGSEPVVLALIFADKIITENNGKKGLIGVFTGLNPPNLPFTLPSWGLYISLTNIEGEHTFSINLVHRDSGQNVLAMGGKLKSEKRQDIIEMPISIGGTVFTLLGVYDLVFQLGEAIAASRTLEVAEPSK